MHRAGRDGHFWFLINLAATFFPSVAVPLSLVGTFAAMYLRLFREFAVTLAVTIIISAVVSLLSPMFCAKLLRQASAKCPPCSPS